jgi:hypothetical protein
MALSMSHCFEEATIEYGSMRTIYRFPVAVEEQPKRTVSVRATDPRQTFVSAETISRKVRVTTKEEEYKPGHKEGRPDRLGLLFAFWFGLDLFKVR